MRASRLGFICLLVNVGCASGDGGTGPAQNLPQGSMSARIDGANWAASAGLAGTWSGGILSIAGTDAASQTLGFATFASGPGTYTIAGTVGTNALLTIGATGTGWSAVSTRGSGTITVNSITATGAAGTFSFVLVPATGTGSNKNITEGRFDVKFQ